VDTRDLDRIRFVTRHFKELQGLALTFPLGLVVLATRLMHALSRAGFDREASAVAVVGVALAVVISFAASRFYRRRFGHIEPRRERRTLVESVIGLIAILLLAASGGFAAGTWVVGFPFFVGLYFFGDWLALRAPTLLVHRAVAGAAFIVLGFAMVARALPVHGSDANAVVVALAGLAFVVVGLLDHRQLVRTMAGLHGLADLPAESPEPLEQR